MVTGATGGALCWGCWGCPLSSAWWAHRPTERDAGARARAGKAGERGSWAGRGRVTVLLDVSAGGTGRRARPRVHLRLFRYAPLSLRARDRQSSRATQASDPPTAARDSGCQQTAEPRPRQAQEARHRESRAGEVGPPAGSGGASVPHPSLSLAAAGGRDP